MAKLQNIKTTDIVIPDNLLRKAVKKDTTTWTQFRASIETMGILQPIQVKTIDGKPVLMDGLQRLTCALDIGMDTVPCVVKSASEAGLDADSMDIAIASNIARFKQGSGDVARVIRNWLASGLTISDISARLPGWTVTQVSNTLSLQVLPGYHGVDGEVDGPTIQLLNAGSLPMGHAVIIAKAMRGKTPITADEAQEYIDNAPTMTAEELGKAIQLVVDNRKTTKTGTGDDNGFIVRPSFSRARADEVYERITLQAEIEDLSVSDLAVLETMRYIYCIDSASVAEAQAKAEAKKAEAKARAEEAKAKAKARAEEAKAKAEAKAEAKAAE